MWHSENVSILLLLLTISLAFTKSLPLTGDSDSLVISSTELPKESSSDSDRKETEDLGVPKIYQMRVDSNVTNRFAQTKVTSKVKNSGVKALETTFSVVLPETAYISGFVMEIGGKNYEAYVKEKEEAKQIYNQAVESGQAAAHVAVSARDSNRFTVSINVAPQSKAIFKLTYEELLQRKNNQYEVVVNIHPGQPVKDLSIQVNINETRPLKFVKVPSLRSGNEVSKNSDSLDPQAIIDKPNPKSAVVKFNPNEDKQKQLAQSLGTKEDDGLAGQFVVIYDVERDPQGGEVLVKDGYFVHFFAPEELAPLPKQVVFVLDTSGSMYGQRIRQLKQAMNSILGELKKEDVFNIVEFSSNVKVWDIENAQPEVEESHSPWRRYRPIIPRSDVDQLKHLPPANEANEINIEKAKKFVQSLDAMGGTDIQSALESGLELIKKHRETNKEFSHQALIIFLTDGEPTVGETNLAKIISKITELNSGAIRSPIFSLSFGDGADRDFLQKISLKNLGFARHIYEAADASLQLEEFYRQISSPLLSDVKFTYVSNVTTKVTKNKFPIFFHGSELIVAGQIEGSIDPGFSPSIWGNSHKGRIELKPVIETSIGALERLWAYLTVKQILEEREAADGNKTKYTQKALDIALKYSFVTPVTSLVVVKPNETLAVDTKDASKGGSQLSNNWALRGGGTNAFYPASISSGRYAGGPAPHGSAGFAPRSGISYHRIMGESAAHDLIPIRLAVVDPVMPTPSSQPTFTTPGIALTTEKPNILENLKSIFIWLNSILDANGTFTTKDGQQVKLGTNEDLKNKDCPSTPVNNTTGICTLLSQCKTIHPNLNNPQVFLDYVCVEGNVAGICCPIEEP